MLHFIKPLMVFSHDTQWVSNGYLPSNMGICFYKNACKGQGHGQYKNQAHLDPPCTSLYSQLCPIMPTALGVTYLHINNSNHNLLLPISMATTAFHTMVMMILWYESHQNEWGTTSGRKEKSWHAAAFCYSQILTWKNMISTFTKEFFIGKKWPKFAKFLW